MGDTLIRVVRCFGLTGWTCSDHNLAKTLIDEFPCRPHWTKNTREVFQQATKNLDPEVIIYFSCFLFENRNRN
jgi:hypothetical protein